MLVNGTNIAYLMVPQGSLRICSFFYILLSFCSSAGQSPSLVLHIFPSANSNLLLNLSSELFISVIVLFKFLISIQVHMYNFNLFIHIT